MRITAANRNSVSRPSTARLAAAAGLLISCAIPAAKRAKGDERAALPGRRLDGARGAVETSDEDAYRREPGVGPIAQHLRGDSQYSTVAGSPASCEIGSVLIPGTKTASPAARHVHPGNDGVLPANMADEINGTVDQHPPEVRVLALTKQLDAGLDGTSVPPVIKSAS